MQDVLSFIKKGKKIRGAKIHIPDEIDVKRIRRKVGMSQKEFSEHYKFNLRALQEWEQGRRVPTITQQVVIRAIDNDFKTVEMHVTTRRPPEIITLTIE